MDRTELERMLKEIGIDDKALQILDEEKLLIEERLRSVSVEQLQSIGIKLGDVIAIINHFPETPA